MRLPAWSQAWRVIAFMVLAAFPLATFAAIVDAIEFYNAGLDHYFVTANADEIGKLDSGYFTGWQRTGQSFKVGDPGTPLAGGSPVCRFYGSPAFGLDSHFYSASPAECDAVRVKFPDAWLLESTNVFYVYLPDAQTGACPSASVPVYRAWNGRVDSNHRYTTDAATQLAMIARGYVAEGYGAPSMPVAMCAPTDTGGAPQCTLTASDPNPVVGIFISLVSSCTGAPTTFSWSGCTSAGSTCAAGTTVAGPVTYAVVASNASGNSPPARVTVNWRDAPPPLPPPDCTLTVTANSDPPVIGSTAVITANCTQAPTRFAWTGCTSESASCTAYETTAGPHTYALVARNGGGSSAPASITITWAASPPPPPDFCASYPSVLRTSMGWINGSLASSSYRDPPGFAWNGAWVVRIPVPANATASQPGRIFVAEFNGPPTNRDVSISRFACDFRTVDASGNNGPVFRGSGTSVNTAFTVGAGRANVAGLAPGQTYYVNIRNRNPDSSISCAPAQVRCDAFIEVSLPQ